MPDVIIKGMEKVPSACCECPCVNGNFCGAKNERPTFEEWYKRKPNWCPLRPATELVRCRECIHWHKGANDAESWEYCTVLRMDIGGDMFCAYGERKDGDGDE